MHRRAIGFILVAIIMLLGPIPIKAEPMQQQTQVQITSPEINEEVRGLIPIMGSASVPNFKFYKIEFGVGPNPAQWALLGALHEQAAVNSQLEVWDTTKLPDGVYTLRLQAVKQDGNYDEFYVRGVAIGNTRPTATLVPTGTPTRIATATKQATPKVTATLQIIAPTAALSMPTVTPTLSRPDQGSELPIDPQSWAESFLFGAVAMGAVFLILGIVFGLRRLL